MKTRFKKNAKIFDIGILRRQTSIPINMYEHQGIDNILFVALYVAVAMLAVLLLCTLTYFYARKNWQSYTKRNLWAICVIDMLIATLYNVDIYLGGR